MTTKRHRWPKPVGDQLCLDCGLKRTRVASHGSRTGHWEYWRESGWGKPRIELTTVPGPCPCLPSEDRRPRSNS